MEDGSCCASTVCSVPPQRTDRVVPDSEIVLGEQGALFRVADLLELTRLVEQLGRRDAVQMADNVSVFCHAK
jgi:hypothetical protein